MKPHALDYVLCCCTMMRVNVQRVRQGLCEGNVRSHGRLTINGAVRNDKYFVLLSSFVSVGLGVFSMQSRFITT